MESRAILRSTVTTAIATRKHTGASTPLYFELFPKDFNQQDTTSNATCKYCSPRIGVPCITITISFFAEAC